MKVTKLTTVIASAFLCLAANAQASMVNGYGAYASTSTASSCPSYCTGDFQYDSDGGQYSTVANSSENTYATTRAFASITTGNYLPTLRVETDAVGGKGGWAKSFASQNFTYTGNTRTTIDLNINLHGSVQNNIPGTHRNQLEAAIAIFRGEDLSWYKDIATLAYEVEFMNLIGSPMQLFITDGLDVNKTGSLSFNIGAGESFFIVTSLKASSVNGYAKSWNTLSLDFTDPTNLVAVNQTPSTSIPAPAGIAALMFSLMVFARCRRVYK